MKRSKQIISDLGRVATPEEAQAANLEALEIIRRISPLNLMSAADNLKKNPPSWHAVAMMAFLAHKVMKRVDARKAIEARHNKKDGSRAKRDALIAIWKTGKFKSKNLCAMEECDALGMSLSTARKALINQ